MTEDRANPSEPRRDSPRRDSPRPDAPRRRVRPRAGLDARPAGTARAAHAPEDDPRGDGEREVRPWEVEAAGPATAEDRPRRRRRTVAELLADVPEDAVIVTRRLTKKYGEFTAVDSLDLTIHRGEVFGLLGPNGAGKTTTVLMLLGLTEPTRGIVRVLGLDPTREPLTVKRHVGYLPDNVGFYGSLTGRENLRYTAKLNGIPRREAEARIDELLAEVRLEDAADKKAEAYSRGMRQRLGIADALVKSPSVLILDEPTIAIDPAGVEELLNLLRRLVREHSLTVLLSSHILGQVQSLCDRVGFYSAGKLVASGPLDELAGGNATVELEVGVEGAPSAIDPVAGAIADVISVAPHERDDRLRVVTATSDVAAPLATALAAAGLPIVHLRRRGTDLLELYRRYVPEGIDGRAS
jgi:ABC-2 type transport system ATP-binding protein